MLITQEPDSLKMMFQRLYPHVSGLTSRDIPGVLMGADRRQLSVQVTILECGFVGIAGSGWIIHSPSC